MDRENLIKLFADKRVRVMWDEEQEKWYFSIVDVIAVLTDSENPVIMDCFKRTFKKRR